MDNLDVNQDAGAKAAIKQKLGQVGRQLKKVDVRQNIVDYPFAAIGIAAAAGAIVGLVRPKPQHGRISSLLFATLGTIGYRLVREAAVAQLGAYAKNYLLNKDQAGQSSFGSQNVEGGSVRYSPSV